VSTKPKVQSATNDDLIGLYVKAAHDHGEATERGDPKAGNKAADMVSTVYRELRNRGQPAQSLLLRLLGTQDLSVRSWAAAHALEFAPEKGEPVLEALSNQPRWLGFSARTTLKVWREGKLRFP